MYTSPYQFPFFFFFFFSFSVVLYLFIVTYLVQSHWKKRAKKVEQEKFLAGKKACLCSLKYFIRKKVCRLNNIPSFRNMGCPSTKKKRRGMRIVISVSWCIVFLNRTSAMFDHFVLGQQYSYLSLP